MRFVSWNVNGLRAAIRKGIDSYFEELDADVTMLQETRTLEEQLPKNWSWPTGWQEGASRGCRALKIFMYLSASPGSAQMPLSGKRG